MVGSPGDEFNGQNWLIVPDGPLLPPAESYNQGWLLTLTGVFIQEIIGGRDLGYGWRSGGLVIAPDVQSPLNFALDLYGIPTPSSASGSILPFFNLDPVAAAYVNVTGVYDPSGIGAGLGFRLDSWEISTQDNGTDVQGNPAHQVFTSVGMIALTQNMDRINRVAYNLILRGKIVFLED